MKLVSVDIWDTILCRRIHPEAIKRYFSEKVIEQYFDQIKPRFQNPSILHGVRREIEEELADFDFFVNQNEGEYFFRELAEKLISRVFLTAVSGRPSPGELINLELDIEKNYVEKIDEAWALVSALKPDRIVLTSDFYHDQIFLRQLLNHVQSPFRDCEILVSCEKRRNKRRGGLFKVLKEKYPGFQIVHLGDNYHSDFVMPQAEGLGSQKYKPRGNVLSLPPAVEFCKKIESETIFPSFINWIIEIAQIKKFTKVIYFSREGYFFSQIQNELCAQFGIPMQATVVEVSRRATYFASRKNCARDSFISFSAQYPQATWRTFLLSMGIDSEKMKDEFDSLGLSFDDAFDRSYDLRWQDPLKNVFFVEKLESIQTLQRQNLKLYLDPIFQTEERVMVVDIGWYGSIAENLAAIYPHVQFESFYLGVLARSEQMKSSPKNLKKCGYLFDALNPHLSQPVLPTTPFEILSHAQVPSLVSYSRVAGQLHNYEGIQQPQSFLDAVLEWQTGVLKKISVSVETVLVSQGRAIQNAKKTVQDPDEILVDLFYRMNFDEVYGNGAAVRAPVLNFEELISCIWDKASRQRVIDKLKNGPWREATLKRYHLLGLFRLAKKVRLLLKH